jgi:predicted ATP-grasp superfamily ATP-dependent carboligase
MSKAILIGEISSYKAITISCFIKTYYPSVKVYGYDFKKYTKRVHTKYIDHYFDLHGIRAETSDTLLAGIINNHGIRYFLPVNSSHIGHYLKNRDLFGNTLDYMGSYESYKRLDDKAALTELAQSLAIITPKTFKTPAEITLPCVVKPINLSSASGVRYIRNQRSLDELKRSGQWDKNLIVQEYVAGRGAGLATFCNQGNVIISSGHKRLAEYPVTGGASVYREEFTQDQMSEVVASLVNHTNWSGFAMFEFKIKADNTPVLIEVNPRIWGSINQGLINGVNYFESLLGKTERIIPLFKNFNTYLSPLIYLAFIKYLGRMDIKPLLIFLKNHGRNIPDISLYSDPKGWVSTILRKL